MWRLCDGYAADLKAGPEWFVNVPNRQQPGIGAQMGLDGLDNEGLFGEKIKPLAPNTLRFHLGPPWGDVSDPTLIT
jgi:hypothetical protein